MNDHRSLRDRVQDSDERYQMLQDVQAYEHRHRWSLLIGIVVGITLGLFIGWVVWPVQWNNAWPSDLSPEARADYIAAVADAYAGDPTSVGAALAAERLASFGENVDLALAEARTVIEQNPSDQSTAQIANIDALEVTLSQPLEAVTVTELEATSPEAEPEATVPVEIQAEETTEDRILPAQDESSNWLALAIWLFVAFVLIAGGLYLLRAVLRMPAEEAKRDDEPDVTSDIDDDSTGALAPVAEMDEGLLAEQELADQDPADERGLLSIEEEDPTVAQQNITVMAGSAGVLLSDEEVPDPDGYGFAPEPEIEQASGISTTIIAEIDADEDETVSMAEEDASAQVPASELAESDAAPPDRDLEEAKATGGAAIATFNAHFQRSLDDYEEAFAIEDPSGYLGDCGMGVNMKVGQVDNNPENVAVLDVWLVDQLGESQTSFHAISLISQHGVSAKLPARLAESTNPTETVLVPQTGVRFQIVGESLIVDCEVVDVRYTAFSQLDGVFTECQVEMIVRERLS